MENNKYVQMIKENEAAHLIRENEALKEKVNRLGQRLEDFEGVQGPELVVCVKGECKTGKSTVAKLIEDALVKEGVDVQREDHNGHESFILDESPGVIENTVQERKESLINKELFVLVETEMKI